MRGLIRMRIVRSITFLAGLAITHPLTSSCSEQGQDLPVEPTDDPQPVVVTNDSSSSDAPVAMIFGAPSGTSSTTILSVDISGTGVEAYKYKLIEGTSVDCADETDYSEQIPVSTRITDVFSSLANGPVTLCVVGANSAGVWQDFADAASESWTKDVTNPGTACNPGYYPVGGVCTAAGLGYFSSDGMFRYACPGALPAHAIWTSSTQANQSCPWFCDEGYMGSYATGETACTAVSSSGIIVATGQDIDDTSFQLNPCKIGNAGCVTTGISFPFVFNNVNYGTDGNGGAANGGIHFGSNNYLTFGYGSGVYSGFSAANPGRGIFLNARDNRVTFLHMQETTHSGGIKRFRLNYKGYQFGQPPNTYQNIIVDVFSNQKINVSYGAQYSVNGVSRISYGTQYTGIYGIGAYATVGNPNATSTTLPVGANLSFSLQALNSDGSIDTTGVRWAVSDQLFNPGPIQ